MMSQEYKRTFADPCVYFRRFPDDKFIILLLSVIKISQYIVDISCIGVNQYDIHDR